MKLAFCVAAATAPVGATFTFLALVTGAIWGQPMWGSWWEWDPRLTSELILLFLFLGYIFLRQALRETRQADRASAILAIVGVINVPIIHYSVEWWTSIHQGPSLAKLDTPSIAGDMLWPLLIMIAAYQLLFLATLLTGIRAQLLEREKATRWVNDLLKTGVIGEGAL
jgi:heme exporter protein C